MCFSTLISFIKSFFFSSSKFGKIKIIGPKERVSVDKNIYVHGDVIFDVSKGGTIRIGKNCSFFHGTILATYGGHILIGHECSFNPYSVIYGHGNLTIGDYVRVATHTVIIPAQHIYSDINTPIYQQGVSKKGITIGDNVWLGAGCKIMDGVTIGSGSIVGAGSVVTSNVEQNSIYVGIPAKYLKSRT